MPKRKFKINPPYFLFMILGGLGGTTALYFGLKTGNSEPLLQGGFLLLISAALFVFQIVPIPEVGERVEREIERLFPAGAKRRVLILLTNGFTGYNSEGVYLSMLKFSKGGLKRLRKLSRALSGQSDFRDALEQLEYLNRKMDEDENKQK